MKLKIKLLSLVAILLVLSSCATILGGTKKGVRVTGEPANSKVYYNGSYVGDAPVSVKVPKSAKQGNSTITIKAENYNPSDVQLTRKWSFGYTILDIVTGVVPLVIDGVTGNIYQPKPNKVKYNLEPISGISNKFKVGDKVIILSKKYENQQAEVTAILADGLKVTFTREANAIEKQTKKVEEITEEIEVNFSEVRKEN